jgi:hypothetical protein
MQSGTGRLAIWYQELTDLVCNGAGNVVGNLYGINQLVLNSAYYPSPSRW